MLLVVDNGSVYTKHLTDFLTNKINFEDVTFEDTAENPQDKTQKKMKKDFEIFKKIRLSANSGLYKHRTKQEIDSIYNWADKQIYQSSTYREFYNIICQLTDFEGSLHNDTGLPKKLNQSLNNEKTIKINQMRINSKKFLRKLDIEAKMIIRG
ncbi:hypothetical protein LCGC14_2513290, partial [marine sediment metagenome]